MAARLPSLVAAGRGATILQGTYPSGNEEASGQVYCKALGPNFICSFLLPTDTNTAIVAERLFCLVAAGREAPVLYN